MGIQVKTKTQKPATLKMLNALTSYIFEQECGELAKASKGQIKALKEAIQVLSEIL